MSGVKVQEVISLDEESLNCLPYVDFFDFALVICSSNYKMQAARVRIDLPLQMERG